MMYAIVYAGGLLTIIWAGYQTDNAALQGAYGAGAVLFTLGLGYVATFRARRRARQFQKSGRP